MLCRLPQAAEGHLKWEDKNGGLSGVQPPYSRVKAHDRDGGDADDTL